MIRSAKLAQNARLVHGLTTRDQGSVGPADDPAAQALRRDATRAIGGDPRRLVAPHQVHEARVAIIGEDARPPGRADGVATSARGVTLMVQGADCPLVALLDPDAPVIALVHSGWRGAVRRIADAGVRAVESLGGRASRLQCAVFPGICAMCFEVGPEVVEAFAAEFGDDARAWSRPSGRDGHVLFDLPAAIVGTLVAAGVVRERVDVVTGCTVCGDRLWSHRASGGGPERAGLFAVLV